MIDTLERWAATVVLILTISMAAVRRARRASARRRLRRQYGAY